MAGRRLPEEIDWNDMEKLCQIQCTIQEISNWFKCSIDTIERRIKDKYSIGFAEYFSQNSAQGKASLRRVMWQKALAGDKTLLIFLAKQHLGMSDKVDYVSTPTVYIEKLNGERIVLGADSTEANYTPERTGNFQ